VKIDYAGTPDETMTVKHIKIMASVYGSRVAVRARFCREKKIIIEITEKNDRRYNTAAAAAAATTTTTTEA